MKKWDAVDPNKVLEVSPQKVIFLGGLPITEIDLKNLQEEIKTLKNMKIWEVFQETIKQKAVEKGLLNSKDWEETLAAKMMLHNLGIQKTIADIILKTVYPHKIKVVKV